MLIWEMHRIVSLYDNNNCIIELYIINKKRYWVKTNSFCVLKIGTLREGID